MYKFPKSEHLNYIYQMLYCQWLHVLSIPGSLELENIFQAANNNTQEHLLTQLLLVFFNCYWSLSRVSAAPKTELFGVCYRHYILPVAQPTISKH